MYTMSFQFYVAARLMPCRPESDIVFVWSQYDGVNIDKEQLAQVPSKT